MQEHLRLTSKVSVVYIANEICRRSSVVRKENANKIPMLWKNMEMPLTIAGQVRSSSQKRYETKAPLVGWFQFIMAVLITGVKTNRRTDSICRNLILLNKKKKNMCCE